MTGGFGASPDPRDVDAEFARMLAQEGLELRPGTAPQEPVAPRRPDESHGPDSAQDPLWSVSADSPPEPPTAESIARSRAAHPSAGAAGHRGAAGPREREDDEVLYGDFDEPDPDLPAASDAAVWSWTALLGGFVLLLITAVTPSIPSLLGGLGGLCALGGVVALLLRAPREPRDDSDDGAQV